MVKTIVTTTAMKFETENHAFSQKLANQRKSFATTRNAAYQDNMLVMVIMIAEISATKRPNFVRMDKDRLVRPESFNAAMVGVFRNNGNATVIMIVGTVAMSHLSFAATELVLQPNFGVEMVDVFLCTGFAMATMIATITQTKIKTGVRP
jgi:hypothetical protein